MWCSFITFYAFTVRVVIVKRCKKFMHRFFQFTSIRKQLIKNGIVERKGGGSQEILEHSGEKKSGIMEEERLVQTMFFQR